MENPTSGITKKTNIWLEVPGNNLPNNIQSKCMAIYLCDHVTTVVNYL